jgi:ADP-heptose:LPS heptosyltransferase
VHIASALNTPTIAVYGPTNPDRYGPYKNPASKVIRPVVDCAPCYKDGYIKDCKDMKCWNSISPFDIIEMIKDLGKYE